MPRYAVALLYKSFEIEKIRERLRCGVITANSPSEAVGKLHLKTSSGDLKGYGLYLTSYHIIEDTPIEEQEAQEVSQ